MANNTKNTASNTSTTTITFTKKTIALIVTALGALLLFIGTFGDSLVTAIKGGGESLETLRVNLKFLFKTGWENLIATTAGFQKLILIIGIVSFFIALLGIIAIVGKNIYSIYKKEDIKLSRSIGLLSIAGLQYLAIPRILFSAGTTGKESGYVISTSYGLGWGSILITIGFFILLVGLFINEMDEKKQLTQSFIVSKIGIVLAFFVALFGTATIAKLITSNSTVGPEFSSFEWYIYVLQFGENMDNLVAVKALAIISIILTMLALVAFFFALYKLILGDLEKDGKKLIVFGSIYFVIELIANILLSVSLGMSPSAPGNHTSSLNSTAIAGIVLGALFVIAIIVSVALRNKTLKYVKSK